MAAREEGLNHVPVKGTVAKGDSYTHNYTRAKPYIALVHTYESEHSCPHYQHTQTALAPRPPHGPAPQPHWSAPPLLPVMASSADHRQMSTGATDLNMFSVTATAYSIIYCVQYHLLCIVLSTSVYSVARSQYTGGRRHTPQLTDSSRSIREMR